MLLRRVLFNPPVYHGTSLQCCVFTCPGSDFPGHFTAPRMNCHVPLFGLDPNADGVSHVSVFHRVSLDPNQRPRNAR